MRFKSLITLLLIFPLLMEAQSVIGEWDSYTSVLNVRDVLAIDNSIVAASGGGLVEFDRSAQQFNIYTIRYGLTRNDIQCLAEDKFGRLWLGMGSPDGEINIWNSQTKTVEEVFNSFEFGDELTSIVSIVFTGNKAFAAYRHNVDWGIAYFKIIDGEYRYQDRLEAFPMGVSGINSLQVINDTLWLAATTGLLYANLAQTDLKPESAWQIVNLPESGNVSRVISYAGKSLFNLDNKIYEIRDGQSYPYNENQPKSISDLILDNAGELYAVTSSGIDRFTSGTWTTMVTVAATKCSFDSDNILWGGSQTSCLWSELHSEAHYLIPNTILDNVYTALYVNEDGSLMAGTQKGFSLLTDDGWYNIRGLPTTDPAIGGYKDRDWSRFVADNIAYSL
ncbi:MAG: two-component regulator propeller domain-containing protein, partial [Candidatus Marinimicrobia bacterium]|nr:two-component regulator propeller domain-containing protein [Candidatus Neomarinimicrobiota bacterium]